MKMLLDTIGTETKPEMVKILTDAVMVLNMAETLREYENALTENLNKKTPAELEEIIVSLADECRKVEDEFLWKSAIIKELY